MSRQWGQFRGEVKTQWIRNCREMLLLEDFTYDDPSGRQWTAPAGAIINGASIPERLWSIVGAPYTGLYREASVIHDVFCVTRTEPYQAVHSMFYRACRCAGVSQAEAAMMYRGVMLFGPKW